MTSDSFNQFRQDVADAAYGPSHSLGKTQDEIVGQIKSMRAYCDEMMSLDGAFFKILRERADFHHLLVELLLLSKSWVIVWGDKLSPESLQQFRELEEKILAVAKEKEDES